MVALPNKGKSIFFHLVLVLSCLIFQIKTLTKEDFPDFPTYCKQYNKVYDNGQYGQRQQIYNQNIQYIINSNCSSLGVNMFTDSTPEEMEKLKGGFEAIIPEPINETEEPSLISSGITLTDKTPLSYDWRDFGAVTSVKNQRSCGSCWAFSTTAFFQSDLIIGNNYSKQIDLSEQFLLKCDNKSLECDGGFIFWAMNTIIEGSAGMPTQSQYPYDYSKIDLENGMCYETDLIKLSPNKKMISFFDVEDPRFIEKMILKKPVNVNLCSKDMQYYAPSGSSRTLFCSPTNTRRDHTVLLVGYTETEWIIKNQWSTDWGVQGYGYVSKNSDTDCCIGKQLYTTGVISQQCNVTNCALCVQETSCFQCRSGYYVYNTNQQHVCRKCNQLNCKKCINYYGLCDICEEGYSISYPTFTCKVATIEHCNFMYLNECAQCHEGYVLNSNGQCFSSKLLCYVEGCQKCKQSSPTVCISCSAGYFLNNDTSLCDKIPECNVQNCSRCVFGNPNKCEICSQTGFYFQQSQNKCVLSCNIEGCLGCQSISSISKCKSCIAGFKLSEDRLKCIKCQIQYCKDCTSEPTLNCSQCFIGFYFNVTSNKCQRCSQSNVEHCIECSLDSVAQKFKCSKCANGFTLNQDGTKCLRCLANCASCISSSLSLCAAESTPTNYFSFNVSKSCPVNCLKCESDSNCLSCLPGCILQNGICYKMCEQSQKCATCQYGIDKSVCAACFPGYKLINDTCIFDNNYECLQQNGLTPDSCTSCPQRYYLNPKYQRKKCSKCQTTDLNCVNCLSTAPKNCSKCADQYYLQRANLTCISCSSFDKNCLQCEGNNQCSLCKQGYFILSVDQNDQKSGKCYPCSPSCKTCKYNSQFCLSCPDGYQLTLNRKCLKKAKIKFTLVVDANYDSVVNNFLMNVYDSLAQLFSLKSSSKEIEIIKVEKGSIKVTGLFHMPDEETDKDAFLERTKNILQNETQIAGYPLMSSQAELYVEQEALRSSYDFPVGVLIGVAAGGSVFFIVIVIVMVIVIRKYVIKKGRQVKQKVKEKQQNKIGSIESKKDLQSQQKSNKTTKTAYPIFDKISLPTKTSLNDPNDNYLASNYPPNHPYLIDNQTITI